MAGRGCKPAITAEMREAMNGLLDELFEIYHSTGVRDIEKAVSFALRSAPVRETIMEGMDIYLEGK